MKIKEMTKLMKHFDTYFEQKDSTVLHPIVDNGFHVDVLFYRPTEKYPFWKLATMGASDFRMPGSNKSFGNCNEYIMFIDKSENLDDKEILSWYHNKLVMIASYPKFSNTCISYGHSCEWQNEDEVEEMVAAFIELPQIIPDSSILYCKLGLLKKVTCLQMVLLNKSELDELMKIGPQAFSEYLYPEKMGKPHFLSERHRSEKF